MLLGGSIKVTKFRCAAGRRERPRPGALFQFELECIFFDGETGYPATSGFELAGGESIIIDSLHESPIPVGTECSLTETESNEATRVSGELAGVPVAGHIAATVVNRYGTAPAPPPTEVTITVVKRVVVEAGATGPAAGAAFGLILECLGQEFGGFTLTDGESASFEVPSGTQCSLAETDSRGCG